MRDWSRFAKKVLPGLLIGMIGMCLFLALNRAGSRIQLDPSYLNLPADGREHQAFVLHRTDSTAVRPDEIFASTARLRFLSDGNGVVGILLAPVMPSDEEFRIGTAKHSAVLHVKWVLDSTDTFNDGTPDFLRLHSSEDRQSFRAWFAAIAEAKADDPADKLPAEIHDCAGLLRYCYTEALRNHDDAWLAQSHWENPTTPRSIRQFHYPYTPLGAPMFRMQPGSFLPDDLKNGSFAQFADARTLMIRNTYLVSRDIHTARKGDLIFYRQLEQNSPYHSMIVTGDKADWVIYHTGPIGKQRGEMRRVLVSDLLRHPDARWRPLQENSNFLGVYRWNILREGG